MNLEGISYNLQQTESKSDHLNRRYSLSNLLASLCVAYDVTRRHCPAAGNNVTCNTLQMLFDSGRLD